MQAISDFLDQEGELVERVRQDLVRGLKKPQTGREGMDADQVLRSFVLKRIKNWDLRELRERIADGITLRDFTTFRSQRVPRHDAFHRAFHRLTPETVRALNEAVIRAAVELGIEDGKKLRVDTTVVETDIHHPTDSSLLSDSVRVITRLVLRLGEQLPGLRSGFPNRTRRARRRSQEIDRMDRQQRRRRQGRKYRELLQITEEVVEQARQVVAKAQGVRVLDAMQAEIIEALKEKIAHFCGLAERVMVQTRRRVLEEEQVPAGEKILSIFEPHTDVIKRGKVDKPTEFGHKVFLAESDQGLITDYRILKGNPTDDQQVEPSLQHHQQRFGGAPELYAADRGFDSQANLEQCKQAGVQTVCIPLRGGQKTAEREAYEKSPAFKNGQRFRAGIEGRISVLFRGRGMKRCLEEGRERFEVFVGAAVLANNLLLIAHHLRKKRARRRRPD